MRLIGSNGLERQAEIIGHELRNPLASAVANLSVCAEMTDAEDPRSTFLSQVMTDLARMSTLLTAYLDFGSSPGRRRLELDLAELVVTVVTRFAEHPIDIEFETGEGPATIQGDSTLLERMLENLLENALSMGATRVDVYLSRETDACVLHVSDNGPGVALNLREDLFDPNVSGRGSSGLGLALARDIVESHGGSITLLPSAIGAVFRVSLPVSCAR